MKSQTSCLCYVLHFLMILVATMFPSHPSHSAQQPDIHSKAEQLYFSGKYDEALAVGKQALQEDEKRYGQNDIKLANSLDLLAMIYNKREDYKQAVQCLERLRSIQEDTLGPNHADVAKTISRLIKAYEMQGDSAKANQLNAVGMSRWGGGNTTDYIGRRESHGSGSSGQTIELTHERDVECANYIRMYRECLTVSCTDQRIAFLNKESHACMDQAVAHRDKRKMQIESMETSGKYVPYNFEELLMVKEYRRFQATLQNRTNKQLNAIGRSVDAINELGSGNWAR